MERRGCDSTYNTVRLVVKPCAESPVRQGERRVLGDIDTTKDRAVPTTEFVPAKTVTQSFDPRRPTMPSDHADGVRQPTEIDEMAKISDFSARLLVWAEGPT